MTGFTQDKKQLKEGLKSQNGKINSERTEKQIEK
jgi:hypothetical protein